MWTRCALVTWLITILALTGLVQAQGEPPATLINNVTFAGGAVGDVCYDPAANLVYVIDASNNDTYVYDASLSLLGVSPSVFPSGTVATGIAADSVTGAVFWVTYDGATGVNDLWTAANIAGVPTLVGPIAGNPGTIVGIDIAVGLTNTIIANDFTNATTFTFDFTGVVTLTPFANPFGTSTGVAHMGGPYITHSADALGLAVPTHLRTTDGSTATAIDAVGVFISPAPAVLLLGFDYGPSTAAGGFSMYGAEVYLNELYHSSYQRTFMRGDTNSDSLVDLADVAFLNGFFGGLGPAPSCGDAADVDDNGTIDPADSAFIAAYLFAPGAPQPPAPGPFACGYDPTFDSFRCSIPGPSCP